MRTKADAIADPQPINATLAELDRLHAAANLTELSSTHIVNKDYTHLANLTTAPDKPCFVVMNRKEIMDWFSAIHNAYPELRAEVERLRQANALLADFVGDERERALAARDARMKALGAAEVFDVLVSRINDRLPVAWESWAKSEAARLRREAGE